MSDMIKAALILSGTAIIVTAMVIFFSPFQTCMRMEGSFADTCAIAAGGR